MKFHWIHPTIMINRKKLDDDSTLQTLPKRCFSIFNIILLCVSSFMIGGIFELTTEVAHSIAGRGVLLSLLLASYASVLATLCYAEFAAQAVSRLKAGNAYAFTYVFKSEYAAFFILWSAILEYMIGAAYVARVWSGYVDSLVDGAISNYTRNITGGYTMGEPLANIPDFLASGICLVFALLLGLGVKTLVRINSLLVIVNLITMGLIIVLGIYWADYYYEDISNWSKNFTVEDLWHFVPSDFSGVIRGAAVCFYAYKSFALFMIGEEAGDPQQSISQATLFSMMIVMMMIIIGTIGSMSVPLRYLWFYFVEEDFISPFSEVFFSKVFLLRDISWIKYVIRIATFCGLTTTLFGFLFSLSKTMYSMAYNGLLFGFLGRVKKRTQVPICNIIISGLFSALIALLFDPRRLVELMSLGLLLTYTIVAFGVIILRHVISEQQLSNRLRYTVDTPNSFSSPFTKDSNNNIVSRSELLCKEIGKFKPRYAWINDWLKLYIGSTSKYVISIAELVYTTTCFFIGYYIKIMLETSYKYSFTEYFSIWIYVIIILVIIILISMSAIIVFKKNPLNGKFRVPLCPLISALLSILFNIILMMQFSLMTFMQFAIWSAIGIIIYFLYGIRNSKETINIPTQVV